MNADFLDALRQIEKEKEIPLEVLLSTIESALETAYKKNFAATGDVRVRVSAAKGGFQVYCEKDVVDDVENEHTEISVTEARKHDPDVQPGDVIEIEVTPANFGRIAAQTAKQVVVQRIREAERERVYEEFGDRVGEVLTGTVQRREQRNVFVNLGKIEALLPPAEQVPTEPYRFNDRIKVYVLEVRRTPKGPQVIVSRTHPSLIRRLFELEVPEIAEGIVSIKSVAREPGARTKVAVYSTDEKVDPMGACVGHRGTRVQSVVNELYDEKIDIVRWNEQINKFIGESLSPAKAVSVTCDEATKTARVMMPDNQLSLAIGKSGQNVRLAARLTGWRIDIRSEAQIARDALTEAEIAEVESAPAAASDSASADEDVEATVGAKPEQEDVQTDTEEHGEDAVTEEPGSCHSREGGNPEGEVEEHAEGEEPVGVDEEAAAEEKSAE
ncbi:MAG: transcription termination/antitermination protein NusA [Armatimonadetes bacterium RBG_16_58_9]|nr:MAG: transcription termination/antitermination protein NusA [Armatimonadetes bacterium RBG_16_58_9]